MSRWLIVLLLAAVAAGAALAQDPATPPAPQAPVQPTPPGDQTQPPAEATSLQLVPASPATSRVLGAVALPELAALLQKAGYDVRVVTYEQLDTGALDVFGLLLINLERPLTVTGAAFLSDFVGRGGRLIACSWGPAVAPRRQPAFPIYRLGDPLQVKVTGWSADGNAYLRAADGTPLFRNLPLFLDVRIRATPLIEPLAGTRVAAQWVSEDKGERSPAILLGPRSAYFAPNVLAEARSSRQMLRLLANTIGVLMPVVGPDPGRLPLAELDVALAEARLAASASTDPEATVLLATAEQKAAAAVQVASQPAPPVAAATGLSPAGGGAPPAAGANGAPALAPNGGGSQAQPAPNGGAQAPGTNAAAPAPAPAPNGAQQPVAPPGADGQPAAAANANGEQPAAASDTSGEAPACGLAPIAPSALPVIADAIDAAERVALLRVPCRPKEMRGVLLPRSVLPPSRFAIGRLLDGLRTAGINVVFPEVYSAGLTLAPGPSQDPRFAGHDPVASLLAEAGTRGIAVHAWVSLLAAGAPTMKGGVLANHARWAAQNRSGGRYVSGGQQWLCPSQVDARDAACDGARRAVANLPIQGILLDGVDYGGSAEACYDPTCVALFRSDTSRNPRETLRGEWEQEWMRWRCDRVSTLVRRVTRELRTARPGVPLHLMVAAGTVDPRVASIADWRTWVRSGWVDGICPGSDTGLAMAARKATERTLRLAPSARVMPVMDAARVRTPRHAMALVGAFQEGSAAGILFSAPGSIAESWSTDLSRGCFRQPAALPW